MCRPMNLLRKAEIRRYFSYRRASRKKIDAEQILTRLSCYGWHFICS